jgi:hypothetical protein
MEEGRVAGGEEEIEEMIGEGEKRGLGDWETGRRGDQEHVKNISPSPFLPLILTCPVAVLQSSRYTSQEYQTQY